MQPVVCVLLEVAAPSEVLIGRSQSAQASHLTTPSVTRGQGGSMCSLLHFNAIPVYTAYSSIPQPRSFPSPRQKNKVDILLAKSHPRGLQQPPSISRPSLHPTQFPLRLGSNLGLSLDTPWMWDAENMALCF